MLTPLSRPPDQGVVLWGATKVLTCLQGQSEGPCERGELLLTSYPECPPRPEVGTLRRVGRAVIGRPNEFSGVPGHGDPTELEGTTTARVFECANGDTAKLVGTTAAVNRAGIGGSTGAADNGAETGDTATLEGTTATRVFEWENGDTENGDTVKLVRAPADTASNKFPGIVRSDDPIRAFLARLDFIKVA
jgi:hypothetical protein